MQIKFLIFVIGLIIVGGSDASESAPMQEESTHASVENVESVPANVTGPCITQLHIFMNPGSGGRKAAALLQAGIKEIVLSIEGIPVSVNVWDIRDGDAGKKPGFLKLLNYIKSSDCVDEKSPVRVIAAGGDGTITWTVSELNSHEVPIEKIALGTLPYGTANDFSYAYGWGSSPPGNLVKHGFRGLRKLIKKWLSANVAIHDIWKVTVKVASTGQAAQRNGKKETQMQPDSDGIVLNKTLLNYFSFGVESQVGFKFDSKRTKSRHLNKIVYAFRGLQASVNGGVQLLEFVDKCMDGNRILFATGADSDSDSPRLIGQPKSIITLNIKSFAGGLDLWKSSLKSGITRPDIKSYNPQDPGDGKLELMSYQSLIGLGAEYVKKGNGLRIGQTGGPLTFIFRRLLKRPTLYLQIDGEYFAVKEPLSVEIGLHSTIRVLVNQEKSR